MAPRAALLDLELVEDRLGSRVPCRRAPLLAQPGVHLVVAVVGVEDAAHDELWCDGAVPVVLLQPESDVVAALAPVAVELGPVSEGNRGSGVAPVAVNAKAEMLA